MSLETFSSIFRNSEKISIFSKCFVFNFFSRGSEKKRKKKFFVKTFMKFGDGWMKKNKASVLLASVVLLFTYCYFKYFLNEKVAVDTCLQEVHTITTTIF